MRALFNKTLISKSLIGERRIADRYSSLSTAFQSIVVLSLLRKIRSSQIRVALPLPSRKG
ncbi:beta-phosphoglucomutase [Lactococcus lactis subsp. lactis IO-1]|nr:beta-phosphoglucomutase [Lactococcus lactis subsp. lactis IO-1]